MKLIIDAQLPFRLAELLAELGHDVVHTISLADGNKTTDSEITRLADEQGRVVVSKDHDFLDGHLLIGSPKRLVLVTTGNIHNDDLLALFRRVEPLLVDALERAPLVELNPVAVVVH